MSGRRMLPQSEVVKQRQNLLRVCGMALKSVVDKSCFEGVLSDGDPGVRNLLVILENILMHRCKQQGLGWFSDETPSFWPCIASICSKIKRSCIPAVMEMGLGHSGLAMGRVFLQMALMERRLSEYLDELHEPDSKNMMQKAYEPDAFMLKDEGAALSQMCLGLGAIDFSFCPKGVDLDYQYVPCIDFAPYLDFSPCSEAMMDDEHEQAVLSGRIKRTDTESGIESDCTEDTTWKIKFQKLYLKYRDLSHQKSYAEDMLSLKQARIEKLEKDLELQHERFENEVASHARHISQLQELVMDLKLDLGSSGRERSLSDRRRLELFLTGLSRNGKFHEAIALKDMMRDSDLLEPSVNGDTHEDNTPSSLHGSAGESEGQVWCSDGDVPIKIEAGRAGRADSSNSHHGSGSEEQRKRDSSVSTVRSK